MGTIALSDLYGLLLQPLEAALGVRQRLIVIPDGELHKVPLCGAADAGWPLPGGCDLLRGKTGVAPTVDLLLVANPAFDDQAVLHMATLPVEAVRAADFAAWFTPLPGTAKVQPQSRGANRELLRHYNESWGCVGSNKSGEMRWHGAPAV